MSHVTKMNVVPCDGGVILQYPHYPKFGIGFVGYDVNVFDAEAEMLGINIIQYCLFNGSREVDLALVDEGLMDASELECYEDDIPF